MMRIKHAALALVPCLAMALPALARAAAEPRYTYAEIGYINVDFDDVGEDGDGFGIGGSYAVHRNVHLVADYADIDLGGNADATTYSLGAGLNFPLRPGLDLVGRLRWIDVDIDTRNRSRDEDGYGLEGGLRTMINPQLELNGFVRYIDLDRRDDMTLLIGALYGVADNLALGADLEFSDDVVALFLKARLYFPPFGRR